MPFSVNASCKVMALLSEMVEEPLPMPFIKNPSKDAASEGS